MIRFEIRYGVLLYTNKIRIECQNLIGWEAVHMPAYGLAYGLAELQSIITKENTDFFVVLFVWVYNKALISLEFGPYGKYLLWRHAARTSLRSVRTAWRHNKYFRVWTALSVNKSMVMTESDVKCVGLMIKLSCCCCVRSYRCLSRNPARFKDLFTVFYLLWWRASAFWSTVTDNKY